MKSVNNLLDEYSGLTPPWDALYNGFDPHHCRKLTRWWTTRPQPRRVTLAIQCALSDGGRSRQSKTKHCRKKTFGPALPEKGKSEFIPGTMFCGIMFPGIMSQGV
jgi:hypothetical protein